ncbi:MULTISPECIES: GNAT family N-acetyltransferase [unclassified Curtobacterium]|uniref:GNAT family N-acetyltransferase n=1 Tax=unclassified Curtobacterium TaxID=257496 RepID=UPI003A80128A
MLLITEGRPDGDELLALYRAVGWTAYTDAPETLVAAVGGSHLVLTARSADGSLVGLVRTVSDGATVVYVQDLLVLPDRHRSGINDAEPGQRAFYESRGFVEVHDVRPAPLRSFVRLR